MSLNDEINSQNNLQKNIIKTKKNNTIKEYKFKNEFYFCPKCKINIPIIIPILSNDEKGNIEYIIKCPCNNNEIINLKQFLNVQKRTSNIDYCEECFDYCKNEKYLFCLTCNKWYCQNCREKNFPEEKEHIFINSKIYFLTTCNNHPNIQSKNFCLTCLEQFCSSCLNFHEKSHNIININEYYSQIKEKISKTNIYEFIDSENQNNKILFNKYSEICIKNNKIVDLNISEAFLKNNEINLQLATLIKLTYEQFIQCEKCPNPNLIFNMDILSNFNKSNLNLSSLNLNNISFFILLHLKTDFLINFDYLSLFTTIFTFPKIQQEITSIIELNVYIYVLTTKNNFIIYDISQSKILYDFSLNNFYQRKDKIDSNENSNNSNDINSISTMENDISKEMDLIFYSNFDIFDIVKLNNNKFALGINKYIIIYCFENLNLKILGICHNKKCLLNKLYLLNNNILCSIIQEKEIIFWNLDNFTIIKGIKFKERIYSFVQDLEDKIFLGTNQNLYTLNTNDYKLLKKKIHNNIISGLINLGNHKIMSGSNDQEIKIFSYFPIEIIYSFKMKLPIQSIMNIKENLIGIILENQSLHIFDVEKLKEINYFKFNNDNYILINNINNYLIAKIDNKDYKLIKLNKNKNKILERDVEIIIWK